MKPFVTLLALAFSLTLWGCASASGAYDAAVEAETAGNPEAAFGHYVTALKRDPDIANARGRVAILGRNLATHKLAEADGARPVRAADLYLEVERLVSRASEVGVRLDLLAGYPADRDAAFARAISALLTSSASARDAGDFSASLARLREADAYRPGTEDRLALDREARQTYTLWAEDDLASGRFRRAFDSAQSAIGLSDPRSQEALRLIDLQTAILDAGSVRVAFFPLTREGRPSGEGRRGGDDGQRGEVGALRVPYTFVDDLDDVLNDDFWTQPPPFVLSADPADVRRLIRRERDADDLMDRRALLAGLASDLDAHFGAAFSISGWTETEEETSRETRRADRQRGGRGSYDRVRLRLERGATVEYVVVDARTRAVVCDGEVRESERETITVHQADDWRQLDLSRSDRHLFTQNHRDDEQATVRAELRAELAGAVAERAYRCVGQRVP